MDLNTVARGSGLVGGLLWLVRFLLDVAGTASGAAGPLYVGGLVLLAVALVGMGMGLVSKSALWLRVIVGIAFPLLVWSVLEVLHPAGDPQRIDGVFGLVAVVVAGLGLVRSRPETRTRSAGAHAR